MCANNRFYLGRYHNNQLLLQCHGSWKLKNIFNFHKSWQQLIIMISTQMKSIIRPHKLYYLPTLIDPSFSSAQINYFIRPEKLTRQGTNYQLTPIAWMIRTGHWTLIGCPKSISNCAVLSQKSFRRIPTPPYLILILMCSAPASTLALTSSGSKL